MTNALRITAAITTLVTGLAVPSSAFASGRQPSPNVQYVGMTAPERAVARHEVALFVEAGLPLPPLTIRRHHHDLAPCNGNSGLHRTVGSGSVIDICTAETGGREARTILHELAHAWAFHFMTPQQRQAFQDVRGWTYWLDYDKAVWSENGAEQAAEIMVWALSDHHLPVIRIQHHTCADLRAGYLALTGREPLHGFTTYCDSRVDVRLS